MQLQITGSGWHISFENAALKLEESNPYLDAMDLGADSEDDDDRLVMVVYEEASSLVLKALPQARVTIGTHVSHLDAHAGYLLKRENSIFRVAVLGIDVGFNGCLTVTFDNAATLSVEPDMEREAWLVSPFAAFSLTCEPGGRVLFEPYERLCGSCGYVIHGKPLMEIPETCPKCKATLSRRGKP